MRYFALLYAENFLIQYLRSEGGIFVDSDEQTEIINVSFSPKIKDALENCLLPCELTPDEIYSAKVQNISKKEKKYHSIVNIGSPSILSKPGRVKHYRETKNTLYYIPHGCNDFIVMFIKLHFDIKFKEHFELFYEQDSKEIDITAFIQYFLETNNIMVEGREKTSLFRRLSRMIEKYTTHDLSEWESVM